MKRHAKCLLFAAASLGAAALINRWIFKTAGINPSSRFESQIYKWRHGRIRYIAAGKGEPILMVHGLSVGASLLEWEEQIALLSKSYRVYSIDLLGYGASDKPNISYTAYLYASLLNDFISDVIGSPVNVAAAAGSAAVAAAAHALKPELYNKMLLVAPTGIEATDKPLTVRNTMLAALINMPIVGTSIYNILSSRMYLRFSLLREGIGCEFANKAYHSAHFGGTGNKYPATAYLARLLSVRPGIIAGISDTPVHICWGVRSVSNPFTNFAALRCLNDSFDLTVFNKSGAMPHKSQPRKFHALCREFFSK